MIICHRMVSQNGVTLRIMVSTASCHFAVCQVASFFPGPKLSAVQADSRNDAICRFSGNWKALECP